MRRRRPQASAPRPRAAIYCRKSVARGLDRDVNSLTVQREACEAYARAQGWEVVETRYEDGGFSGRNLARPGFQALMRDAAAGLFDRVVVYKLDRLSRSLPDFVKTVAELEERGIGFVSVTQQFDTTSALGRLTMGILASFASFESDLNSERTADAIAAARRKGRWTGGQVPTGYDSAGARLVPNEAEAAVIRELFALYLQLGSVRRTAAALNGRGRRMKNGNRWTTNTVRHALSNPVYIGCIGYDDEVFEGEHEPIVERATFERAQALLASHRSRQKGTPRSRDHLLGGLVECGQCGAAMTPASSRGRGGRRYRYYRCSRRDREGAGACPARPLPAGELEAFVIERIREATADGHLAEDVALRLAERLETERAVLRERHARLERDIGAASARRESLLDSIGDLDSSARRAVGERLERMAEHLATLEAERDEVERRLGLLDRAEVDAEWVVETLARFDAVWDALTPENRRRLVRALVERVVVDEAAGTIEAFLLDLDGVDEEMEAAG